MAVINHSKREINAKLVYFGPSGSGKEALFRYIHQRIKPSLCGPLKSMPSGSDTLLFFDYTPFENSSIDGYRVRIHLYTLPGVVSNPGTLKMILKGVDGIVLVAKSGEDGMKATGDALRSARHLLSGYGRELHTIPRLLLSPSGEQLVGGSELYSCFDSDLVISLSPDTGEGSVTSLARISQAILQHLKQEFEGDDSDKAVIEATELVAVDTVSYPEVGLSERGDSVPLPELGLKAGETTEFCLPVALQSGPDTKRYVMKFSVTLEELPV